MRDDTTIPHLSGCAQLVTLEGFDPNGHPLVSIDGGQYTALSVVDVSGFDLGAELAVTFLQNDPTQPLILGALVEPRLVDVDGRIELVGEKEVVLRCGPASIRLTPDGRVTIRGTRVLSRSDGPNRVQGASVELN